MTQQFKFGDRVRIKDEPLTPWENAGIIFAIYGDEKRGYYAAVCFQESGDFQDVPLDEIERVPHPDTVRLDWLIENQAYVVHELPNEDCAYFSVSLNAGGQIAANSTARQAIDNAMREKAA